MPGKAANAGGVATSALEHVPELCKTFLDLLKKLMQNCTRSWLTSSHKVDDAAKRYGMEGNYVAGANIAGFEKGCRCYDRSGYCLILFQYSIFLIRYQLNYPIKNTNESRLNR